MREARRLERAVGVEWYVSDADGVGGRLRERPEDFRVRELERFDAEPLDADPGSYPYLVVRATLRGWDTNAFARALSDRLQMSRGRVDWAGTKDADAVTTQLFSLRDVDPADLPDVGDADLEPVGRAGRAIEFGDLAGNEFRVTVRDADRPGNADAVTAALRAFAAGSVEPDAVGSGLGTDSDVPVAVPNFFGQQRFGSRRPVTHEVGLRIVRREWRDAALAYVGNPSEAEPPETRDARAAVDRAAEGGDPDWEGLLEEFPRWLDHERAILGRLAESGGGGPEAFRDALETLPWNLQRLFVNAAQSYAFNRILSERLDRGLPFGRAVEGDVVCFAETVDGLVVPDADRTQRATERRVATVNRHCERGRAFVTAPLVGTDTEFADGEPGEIERAVLDDVGLAPADFDLPGDFASSGTRRAVLVRTDLGVARDPLAFSFSLPKGSYATVVLREYLKASPLDL